MFSNGHIMPFSVVQPKQVAGKVPKKNWNYYHIGGHF